VLLVGLSSLSLTKKVDSTRLRFVVNSPWVSGVSACNEMSY